MQEIYEDTKDYLRDVKQVHYVGTRFEKDTTCFSIDEMNEQFEDIDLATYTKLRYVSSNKILW